MKAIIIFLLLIILGIISYNFYSNWKRFHPPNYQYTTDVVIDGNHPNKALLLDYHQAIARLNGYVITQWTANNIDVRNPESDDAEVLAAVTTYREKIGVVKFYEAQLLAPQKEEVVKTETAAQRKKKLIKSLFTENPAKNTFRLGERSPLVFEIQKLLYAKGDTIKIDGVFNTETRNALQSFEKKNGLFPDGKLDLITLEYLLQ